MEQAAQQPSIVIAGADPEWAFALQARIRAAVGWGYDILITFTAEQALNYVLRRAPTLLITEPRMARKAYVMDVPELLAAVRERAPATQILVARSPADDLFANVCRLIGLPAAAGEP